MSDSYHRGELAVALDPSHPSHILPPQVGVSDRVLDVGCGAGQTLIASYSDRLSYGIDVDRDALALGRTLTDRVRFVRASSEALPWADGSFDLVVARVSLPYTDMRRSFREIRRVLAPGGQIWMTLHSFATVWRQARRANAKGMAFFGYVCLNSLAFHLAQRHVRFFGRCESFQTDRGVRRGLSSAGFSEVRVIRGRHFVVTARVG